MNEIRHKIIIRFTLVFLIMVVFFVVIIIHIILIQTTERDELMQLAEKQKISDILIRPKRGNIYSSEGRLLASSIPMYAVFMDTRVDALRKNEGRLFWNHVDSLSIALASFFNDRTPAEYKRLLVNGYKRYEGALRIYPHRITYSQMRELRTLPLFRLGRTRSGLITTEFVRRVKPFGSLASRTIGNVFADESKGGNSGLEGSFDEVLVGTPGKSVRQKIANRFIETPIVLPINGMDVISTIDVDYQEIAENALRDTIGLLGAKSGCVVVMEVKTGKIKAIVNLELHEPTGNYIESENHVLRDRIEPGSTFKIASLMAVLDDGKVKISDTFDTKNGILRVANRVMRDHNYHKGGYGVLRVDEIIHASSNVGTTLMVQRAFGGRSKDFIEKLYDYRLNDSLPLQMKGIATPWIKHPVKNRRNWYATSLAWISIGYETKIPLIYMLTFYNAIANGGTMMKPLFVTEIKRDHEVVQSFDPVVLKEQISKPSTIEQVKEVMLGVVEGHYGTARAVQSDIVRIAGKTGTAQVSQGELGYSAGRMKHNVTFCGFFPYENPQYTCIVFLHAPNGLPSGGRMAGAIFKKIAEGITIHNGHRTPVKFAQQVNSLHARNLPNVKDGNYRALRSVANRFNIPIHGNVEGWANKVDAHKSNRIELETFKITEGKVPDITGMGAKDAVFLLGNLGMDVRIQGRGRVVAQSQPPGKKLVYGSVIELKME